MARGLLNEPTYMTRGWMMADDLKNRGAQDRSRIALNEDHEVRYWTGALNCTRQQLEAAVAAVGNSADKVREYLRKK